MLSPNYFKRGVTLVELIIIMAVSSIVITILMRSIAIGLPTDRTTRLQTQATTTASTQLNRLTRAIRQARESAVGAYPLVEVSPNRLIFYADYNGNSVVERIRYELVDGDLEMGVIVPSGDPLLYVPEDEEVTVVASHLRNDITEPLFTYYTGDYPADTTPLSPTDLTEVKYIQFHLIIDVEPDLAPDPVHLRSQINLRNLKTNLGEFVE